MVSTTDRRGEPRVRFQWPLFFGYHELGELFQGQVRDFSRAAVSIRTGHRPEPGTHVVTRFSYPLHHDDDYAVGHYYHWSQVQRVDDLGDGTWRVVLRLHRPLACPVEALRDEAPAFAVL